MPVAHLSVADAARALRVRTAHADAWQAQGALMRAPGSGVALLPGVRLMASGLLDAQWNGGDVFDPPSLDLVAVADWYAGRRGRSLPWSIRVGETTPVPALRLLLRQRCMTMVPAGCALTPVPTMSRGVVSFAAATPAELDEVIAVDAAAFGGDLAALRAWIGPQLHARGFTILLARQNGRPVGVATSVRTDGWAGPCVGIFGVGVVPRARHRGIGAHLTAQLLQCAADDGATLAHLNPVTDAATRLYARLGFTETAGIAIYAR